MQTFFIVALAAAAILLAGCGRQDDIHADTTSTMISLNGIWMFKVDSTKVGEQELWHKPETNRASWDTISVPMHWDSHKLAAYDGMGWYAKSVDVPLGKGPKGAKYAVVFEAVDDNADVWFNGTRVGSQTGYGQRFFFDVTALLKEKNNMIVVRVEDLAGPGGMIGSVKLLRYQNDDDLLKSDSWYASPVASPDWVRDAVLYEIDPRMFSEEGTFAAIEKRLPELRRLGVTVLWLMPIHPIGVKNRKGKIGSPYSVKDYYRVNPDYGTLEDFTSLIEAAHAQGLHLIIDVVLNHTAWDNPLITEHPDWYTRNADSVIISPNPDWTDVADLNYDKPELRAWMKDMLAYWVNKIGVDGLRCDVSEMVPVDFWRDAFAELRRAKPVFLLAEGATPDLHEDAFDMTYAWNTYDILPSLLSGAQGAAALAEALRRERYLYPEGALRMRFTTNHDKIFYDAPPLTRYGVEGAKAAAVLMHTLPGAPLIYNGQETGSDRRLNHHEKDTIDWRNGDPNGFGTLYETLNRLRREHGTLRRGAMRVIPASAYRNLFLFVREDEGKQMLVAVNLSKDPYDVKIDDPTLAGFMDLYGYCSYTPDATGLSLQIPGFGYWIGVRKRP
ncbi:MAG: alpha-glucosidase C-terminal domain-containing protein [Ignavibacteria bacterium]|nr:alpha-glucosidase C-terminal domain-containing protein [Ignavibacteria bacterium]